MAAKRPARVEQPRTRSRQDDGFRARLRLIRQDAVFTLQVLAARCGLAPSTISMVEQNQISPPYENILRLADGLGLEVAEMLTRDRNSAAPGRRSITRAGKGATLKTAQYEYELLCADLSPKHFTPLLARLRA